MILFSVFGGAGIDGWAPGEMARGNGEVNSRGLRASQVAWEGVERSAGRSRATHAGHHSVGSRGKDPDAGMVQKRTPVFQNENPIPILPLCVTDQRLPRDSRSIYQ